MYMIPFNRAFRTPMDVFDDRFVRSFFNNEPADIRVDVKERGDHYELKADLPGVKQENIDISMDQDVLTISANFGGEEEKKEENGYMHIERRSGSISRSFNLEGIDQNSITASYADGVLTLNLPKEKKVEPVVRHVAINGVVPQALNAGEQPVA